MAIDATERARAVGRVAFRARQIVVSGKRERVAEACRRPRACSVTLLTIVRKAERRMVGCTGVVSRMARVTIRRYCPHRSARMALRTVETGVSTGQWKTRMIEGGGRPGNRAMALLAIMRVAECRVVWCSRILG